MSERRFSGMPTLGEFIQRAKAFGVRKEHTASITESPSGHPVRFYYLQRDNRTAFVVLPDLRYDQILERETVENWCRTLDLPAEDFGLP